MSLIKGAPRAVRWCMALILAAPGESLNINTPNAPDSPRLLTDPASVEQIGVGALRTWYNTTQNMDPDGALIVMARSHTASWNNFQIRIYTGCTLGAWTSYPAPLGTCGTTTNAYPRIEWQNNPAATARTQIEAYWYGYYSALSSANAVLKAIRENSVVPPDGRPMVETMAVLVQALTLSGIALNYDHGYIVTDATPVDANGLPTPAVGFSDRTTIRDVALQKFDEVIALATANTFDVPDVYFNKPAAPPIDNVAVAQIANTMAARTLAYFPRNAAENATVPWARVLGYASKGISSPKAFDWVFKTDGVNWFDYLKSWSNDMRTMRIHTRVAHLMDPTTQPDPFNATTNSQPVWGTTSFDKRLGDGSYTYPAAAKGNVTITPAGTANAGTDYAWSTTKARFPAARGAWHQSAIGQIRYITLSEIDPNGSSLGLGTGPVVLAAENDLIWAEALIKTGGTGAAALINKTRVGRGGLAPATDADANLLQELQYEQDVELPGSNAAPYYNQRRIDNLEPNTPHEMPVPAKELGVLQVPLYTCGGASHPDGSCDAFPAPSATAVAALMRNAQVWAEMERVGQERMRLNAILNTR